MQVNIICNYHLTILELPTWKRVSVFHKTTWFRNLLYFSLSFGIKLLWFLDVKAYDMKKHTQIRKQSEIFSNEGRE